MPHQDDIRNFFENESVFSKSSKKPDKEEIENPEKLSLIETAISQLVAKQIKRLKEELNTINIELKNSKKELDVVSKENQITNNAQNVDRENNDATRKDFSKRMSNLELSISRIKSFVFLCFVIFVISATVLALK